MILLLRLLLSFCFDWEDISNTRDSVSLAIQTPRIWSKILRWASYFQLSSRCLDIPMKHCFSCLIYYLKFLWFLVFVHGKPKLLDPLSDLVLKPCPDARKPSRRTLSFNRNKVFIVVNLFKKERRLSRVLDSDKTRGKCRGSRYHM